MPRTNRTTKTSHPSSNGSAAARIDLLLIQANHLKTVAEEAHQAFLKAQQELVDLMEADDLRTAVTYEDTTGMYYTGTLIKQETVDYAEEDLREEIGEQLWDMITTRVLDKKKLEASVVTGQIPADVVAGHSTVKARRPYIRFAVKPKQFTSTLKF
jgi:hypothetical protein